MNEQFKTVLSTVGLAVVAALAVLFAVSRARGIHGGGEAGAKVWFYDQLAKKLYAAPRDLIPPDGEGDARVRAVVVGFKGLENDPGQLQIAYLEKFSPDFKALLERARSAREARRPFTEKIPPGGSRFAQDNTFVRRPGGDSWQPISSDGARQIMAEWHTWRGPAGQPPVISVPAMH